MIPSWGASWGSVKLGRGELKGWCHLAQTELEKGRTLGGPRPIENVLGGPERKWYVRGPVGPQQVKAWSRLVFFHKSLLVATCWVMFLAPNLMVWLEPDWFG